MNIYLIRWTLSTSFHGIKIGGHNNLNRNNIEIIIPSFAIRTNTQLLKLTGKYGIPNVNEVSPQSCIICKSAGHGYFFDN